MIKKVKALFALNIYQFTSKSIEEIRKMHSSDNSFYKRIPYWIYFAANKTPSPHFVENYNFQFSSGAPDDKWIMFEFHYKDALIEVEMEGCGEEDFIKEVDLVSAFSKIDLTKDYNFPILLSDQGEEPKPIFTINSEETYYKSIATPTYFVVEIEYSGGEYCGSMGCSNIEISYNLIGYLDANFNLVKF